MLYHAVDACQIQILVQCKSYCWNEPYTVAPKCIRILKTHGMKFIALGKKFQTVMLTFSQLYTFEITFNELVQR